MRKLRELFNYSVNHDINLLIMITKKKSSTHSTIDICNAPFPRVRRRYCDVHTQGKNTLTYIR